MIARPSPRPDPVTIATSPFKFIFVIGVPKFVYQATHPPSTNNGIPVTYDAASDARKTAAPVTSCNSPHRPIGILATNALYFSGSARSGLFISVANGPGQIAFTVTPRLAHSSASTRVRLSSPALADAYGARPASAT